MKKITFLLMMLLTAFSINAQTITTEGVEAGTQGANSSYFGYQAGKVTTGSWNTFLGSRTGLTNTTGNRNIFIGNVAGYVNKTGSQNIFIGNSAGRYNVGGHYNTYVGYAAGYKNKASRNVFLGYKAGYYELGNNKLYIDNSPTSSPLIHGDFSSNELTIHGNLDVRPTNGENALDLFASDNGEWNNQIRFNNTTGELRHVITDDYGTDNLVISPGVGPSANGIVQVNGSMLIGPSWVNTPDDYRLYVDVGILTEKVKVASVNSTEWADYVFAEGYNLNSTEEVEQFIKENKHLPNVPSAEDVSKNGVDMVEMDATLLRQIEELWLHVIELKKENDTLKEEVKTLSNK